MAGPEARDRVAREELVHLRNGENIGLQGRFLLGPAFLDPSREFGRKVTAGDLKINADTYRPAEAVSTLERRYAWEGWVKIGDDATQKGDWAHSVAAVVAKKKEYFEAEEGTNRKKLYRELGIDLDDFNEEKAGNMYDRFFSPDKKGRELSLFINDILKLPRYSDPHKGVDLAKVRADFGAISWLSTIFGKGSSLLLPELISAQATLMDSEAKKKAIEALNKKEGGFMKKKRRIDRLNVMEKGLLTYTNEAFQKGELQVPPTLKDYVPQLAPMPTDIDEVLPVAPPAPDVPVFFRRAPVVDVDDVDDDAGAGAP